MLKIALASSRAPIFSLSLLGPLILIPAFSTALLTLSIMVLPPHSSENVLLTDEYGFPTLIYQHCSFNNKVRNDLDSTPAIQIVAVMHITTLISLLWMAWGMKNENIAFNEARGIYVSICVDGIVMCSNMGLSMLVRYHSYVLGSAVVDFIFLQFMAPSLIVSMGNIILIVMPKFRSSGRPRLPVPSSINIESSQNFYISSLLSRFTGSSASFAEQMNIRRIAAVDGEQMTENSTSQTENATLTASSVSSFAEQVNTEDFPHTALVGDEQTIDTATSMTEAVTSLTQ